MSKKILKRSLALGALMAFVITGSAMARANLEDIALVTADSRIENPVNSIDSTLFENFSKNNSGGAVSNSGNATISNSKFLNNSVTNTGIHSYGGAIYNATGATLNVSNTIFVGNKAIGVGGEGGAIFNQSGASITIENCDFINNVCTKEGSAIKSTGTMVVRDSYFTENYRDDNGNTTRSVWVTGGTATFEGNVFEENAGGAIGLVNAGTEAIFKGKNEFLNHTDGTAINTNKSTVVFEKDSETIFDGNRIAIETKGDNAANVTFKAGSSAEFKNNTTVKDDDWGIINHQKGTITFEEGSTATFENNSNNTATGGAGAINVQSGATLNLNGNATFENNTANGVANDITSDGALNIGGNVESNSGIKSTGTATLTGNLGIGAASGFSSLDGANGTIEFLDDVDLTVTENTTTGLSFVADGVVNDKGVKAEDLLADVKLNGSENEIMTFEEGNLQGEKVVKLNIVTDANNNVILEDAVIISEAVNSKSDAVSDAGMTLKGHWRAHMNDMNKRMGELRMANGEHGVWTRMVRGESEYQGAKMQYNQYQLGYDEKLSVDKRWTVGAAVTFSEGDSSYGSGSTDDKSTAFAIYGSKLNNDGTFVDLIARYAHLESDLDDRNYGTGDYSTNGMSVSAEFGKRIQQGNGLWIEPQVELTYGSVDSADVAFDGGAYKAHYDSMDSFIARAGFALGKDIKQGNVYARASYLYDFDGETETQFEGGKAISEDFGGGWWEVGVGANINLSKATYIYADIEKTFGGEVDTNWQWNLGVRYSF